MKHQETKSTGDAGPEEKTMKARKDKAALAKEAQFDAEMRHALEQIIGNELVMVASGSGAIYLSQALAAACHN